MKWSKLQEWAEIDCLPLAVELAADPPKPPMILLVCENRLKEWFDGDEDSKKWDDLPLSEQTILTSVLAWKLCEQIVKGYTALGLGWNANYMNELKRLYEEETA